MANKRVNNQKPGGSLPVKPASDRPHHALLTRGRLNKLGEVETKIRDPYLLDALRQYEVVQTDLFTQTNRELVENDIFLLCELSRDATIRLTPFSLEMRPVMSHALSQFQRTIELLADKPTNENIERYAENIRKRIKEFEQYLALPGESSQQLD